MSNLRIVFMGTPDFAVPSLDILIQHKYNVVAVVTAPDKPSGRGQQLNQSAVKKYAVEKNLTLLQPEKLRNPDFIATLQQLQADLFIVVAFRMLPEVIWKMPTLGTFNLHASLLPQYRGAAPINWAVINGEKETGVTTFFLQHEIDTGNILLQEKIKIEEDDNVGIVHDKLMQLGATLVLKTVEKIEQNSIQAIPQLTFENDASKLKHAPKIFKETCLIDWNKSAIETHHLIRGLSPYPTAFTYLNGKVLKIFTSKIDTNSYTSTQKVDSINKNILEISTDQKSYFSIKCNDGFLAILEVQLEGKKRMKIDEFLRGYRF